MSRATHIIYTDEGRQEVAFLRVGCATDWEKCENGEHAMTVIFAGDTMTSCVHDHDLTEIARPAPEAAEAPKARVPLVRDVRAAEAAWGNLASQYGDDNLATVRARARWRELTEARAERRKVAQ